MSKQKYYQTKLAAIKAVDPKAIKLPNMPVGQFIQEGFDLLEWCKEDKDILISKGLDWSLTEELHPLLRALTKSQAVWDTHRNSSSEAVDNFKEMLAEAEELHAELIHDYRHAFRADKQVLSTIRSIARGQSQADLIQDLNDLVVVGRRYPSPLSDIGFDSDKIDKAVNLSSELAENLAQVNTERACRSELKVYRDQAYTLCKNSVDQIRACGQYAFWQNPDRLKGYFSAYHRKLNLARRNKKVFP